MGTKSTVDSNGNATFESVTANSATGNVTIQGNTFNGVSQLVKTDAAGKIPSGLLPTGTEVLLGQWSAATNTPTLSNSTVAPAGNYYNCSAAGTVNFGAGNITFNVGDHVISNGTIWDKEVNSNAVTSVNGAIGAVVLGIDNLSDVDATTPSNNDVLVYQSGTSTWLHEQLGAVAYTNDYNSLINKPTIPSGTVTSVSGTGTVLGGVSLSGTVTSSGSITLSGNMSDAYATGKLLTGYTVGSNTAIAATDSILSAFGKAQGQISAIVTSGRLLNIRVLTTGTSYTPTSGTSNILVRMIGGGGAGGGVVNGASWLAGSGGGSAGECLFYAAVSSSTSYTYTIGARGNGVSGANGGAGGSTIIIIGATTYTVTGGAGGLVSTVSGFLDGGNSGNSTNGSALINITGQAGYEGFSSGPTLNVTNPGRGGDSSFGNGGKSQVTVSTPGVSASSNGYGAGGSGAATTTIQAARAGGNGSQGLIIIYEYS